MTDWLPFLFLTGVVSGACALVVVLDALGTKVATSLFPEPRYPDRTEGGDES